MKKLRKTILFALLFTPMLGVAIKTVQAASLTVPYSEKTLSIEVDGAVNDADWKSATVVTNFVESQQGTPASPQTVARIIADQKYLYVGFVSKEPDIDKLVRNHTSDQKELWSDDCVEFFIDPTGSRAWQYQWIINPNGALWQGLHAVSGNPPIVESEVKAAAQIGNGQWSAEIQIPWSALMTKPEVGQQVGINFGRERKAGGGNQVTSIAPFSDNFTNPQGLKVATVGSSENHIKVLSLGSGASKLNRTALNRFEVQNSGAKTPVALHIYSGDKLIASRDGAGEELIRLPYDAPDNKPLRFEVKSGAKVLFTNVVDAPKPKPLVWQIENPLYESLFGEGEISKYKGTMMWMHNVSKVKSLRETAIRFGARYVLSEMYRQAGEKSIRLVQGWPPAPDSDTIKLVDRYNVKYMYTIPGSASNSPWILDAKALQNQFKKLDKDLSLHASRVWAVNAGDEIIDKAREQGAALKESPPEGYGYIKEADEEVRSMFGGGKWGIPHGVRDTNPYRWIAYNKWLDLKMHQRAKAIRAIVEKYGADIPLVSDDQRSIATGTGYGEATGDYEIYTQQTYQKRGMGQWRAITGYDTKVLADLTGKEVWPVVHVENYSFPSTPEETREQLSEVFRSGGNGLHLYLPDVDNGNKLVGDTRLTYFGSPRRYETILNIIDEINKMPRLKLPEYNRAGILYNDDMFQSVGRLTPHRHELKGSTESAHTFLGQSAGSWFRFIDNYRVINSSSLSKEFDVIYIPIGAYQRPEIVDKLHHFVEEGGTLICGEPNVFSTDTLGNDTSEKRTALFGVETRGKIKPKVLSATFLEEQFQLPVSTTAYQLVPQKETRVLATFEDGSAAITMHRLGEGRAILFASNPFNLKNNSQAEWRSFFTELAKWTGAPTGLDIWRFQFPDTVLGTDLPTPDGKCLTNNHVTWREEETSFLGNIDLNGSYKMEPAPDAMPDVESEHGWISFNKGRLTDRRSSILAEKVEPKWYVGYKLPDEHWMNSWETPAAVELTYDFKGKVLPGAVKFWFSDTMPVFEVHGSNDNSTWKKLGETIESVEAGDDVKDTVVQLNSKERYRYLRVTFAPRKEGQKLSIVESEVWGDLE